MLKLYVTGSKGLHSQMQNLNQIAQWENLSRYNTPERVDTEKKLLY